MSNRAEHQKEEDRSQDEDSLCAHLKSMFKYLVVVPELSEALKAAFVDGMMGPLMIPGFRVGEGLRRKCADWFVFFRNMFRSR